MPIKLMGCGTSRELQGTDGGEGGGARQWKGGMEARGVNLRLQMTNTGGTRGQGGGSTTGSVKYGRDRRAGEGGGSTTVNDKFGEEVKGRGGRWIYNCK